MITETKEFLRGAWALGPWWRVWMVLVLAANAVAPLLFLPRVAAVVAVAAALMAVVAALVLMRVQGRFTKLQGLIHTPWVPMLALFVHQYPWQEPWTAYRCWLTSSIVLTSICLAIDASDVWRFLKTTPPLLPTETASE